MRGSPSCVGWLLLLPLRPSTVHMATIWNRGRHKKKKRGKVAKIKFLFLVDVNIRLNRIIYSSDTKRSVRLVAVSRELE